MTHQDDLLNEKTDLPDSGANADEASEDVLGVANDDADDEAGDASEASEDVLGTANDDASEEAGDAGEASEETNVEPADEPVAEADENQDGEREGEADDSDGVNVPAAEEPMQGEDAAEETAQEEGSDEEVAQDESAAEPTADTPTDDDDTNAASDNPTPDTGAPDTASQQERQESLDPPLPPSDEPVVYGLDTEKPADPLTRTSRKKTWMVAGGLAAAALLAGAFMLSAQSASSPQDTSTQTVEVEVATKDEEAPAKPAVLTDARIKQMLADLSYDHSDIGLSNDEIWLEIAGGRIDLVQVVDNGCGISPWALTDLTVDRAAALAGKLANSRIKGDDDQKPMNITDVSWQVIDQNGDAYMAVTFDSGFDKVGTTQQLLAQARGYTFSDGMYFALGAETVGYAQQGGTPPTNPWGTTIVPTAHLASYGDGQAEAEEDVEEEAETEEEAEE